MNRINLLNRIRIIISNNIKIFFKEKNQIFDGFLIIFSKFDI